MECIKCTDCDMLPLQFTSSFNHHGADAKVHPNGGNEVLIVAVIRKAKQQTGLSHAWTVTIHFNAFQPFHKVYGIATPQQFGLQICSSRTNAGSDGYLHLHTKIG